MHDLSYWLPAVVVIACAALVIYYGFTTNLFDWGPFKGIAEKSPAFSLWLGRVLLILAGGAAIYEAVVTLILRK
jgi:hypothetical protein